jgi:hypothetical protein
MSVSKGAAQKFDIGRFNLKNLMMMTMTTTTTTTTWTPTGTGKVLERIWKLEPQRV